MNATEQDMSKVHAVITAAIKRHMARSGVTEREAFGEAMRWLMAESPNVARAYMKWIAG